MAYLIGQILGIVFFIYGVMVLYALWNNCITHNDDID